MSGNVFFVIWVILILGIGVWLGAISPVAQGCDVAGICCEGYCTDTYYDKKTDECVYTLSREREPACQFRGDCK